MFISLSGQTFASEPKRRAKFSLRCRRIDYKIGSMPNLSVATAISTAVEVARALGLATAHGSNEHREMNMHSRASALTCIAALWVSGLTLPGQGFAQSSAESELLTIQREWAEARVKPDIAYLERLYAKEFRVHNITGEVSSREEDIAMFRERRIEPDFVRDRDMKVSVHGESAVVTGVENVGGRYPAGPLKGQFAEFSIRFTNVFVRRDGRWQLVIHHGTQIPTAISQADDAATIAQIRKLEQERIQAGVRKDIAFVDAATAEEYLQYDWEGKVLDKPATLARIQSSTIQLQSNTLDEIEIHIYGNTAVVRGLATRKGSMDGKDISTSVRYTRVYVNREGRWQAVQFQQTRVVPAKG
jgi:ketosteroid isomerase-like protein